ncbi:hypothetical protein HBB16_11390 [Pseudonocardia sp. MCCB 268]|nr:hypothetical protein [Pseudonocardia cytotoxica]
MTSVDVQASFVQGSRDLRRRQLAGPHRGRGRDRRRIDRRHELRGEIAEKSGPTAEKDPGDKAGRTGELTSADDPARTDRRNVWDEYYPRVRHPTGPR